MPGLRSRRALCLDSGTAGQPRSTDQSACSRRRVDRFGAPGGRDVALGAPRSVVAYFRRVIIHKITRSKTASAIKISVVNMRLLELEV
jgi:hypothetical protein